MNEKELLMIPGPTMVPPRVLRAMSRPMINHRSKTFAKLFRENNSGLKQVFQTSKEVLTFPGSGTGGLEAAIVNLLSPGDTVLSISVGAFGNRFREIAQRFGANVVPLEFRWGEAIDVTQVQAKLESPECEDVSALLATHNETSTGVTNDVQSLAQLVRKRDCLLLVDAVSSLGAVNLEMEAWDVDVVVTGSQKALMLPPGMTFVALNDRAWERVETAGMPRYYWDFRLVRDFMQRDENPYTPAVSLMYGLSESLQMIQEEGLTNIFQRHQRLGERVRSGVRELGLEVLPEEEVASNTVTAVRVPAELEASRLTATLREKHQVVVAGGQGPLKGKVFRIGHLGYVNDNDVTATLHALRMALAEVGYGK